MDSKENGIILEFCKNKDPSILNQLTVKSKIILFKFCSIALTKVYGNHVISHLILNYFNRNLNGGKNVTISDDKKALEKLNRMSIAFTGSNNGEILIGSMPATADTIVRFHGQDIAPFEKSLDLVRSNKDLWARFLTQMNSLTKFVGFSNLMKEIWLETNENSNKEIGNVRIEIIQPGNSKLRESLTEEQLDDLVNGNPNSEDGFWSSDEINDMIVENTGKPTLIFYKEFWKIPTDYKVVSEYDQIKFTLEGEPVHKNKGQIYVLSGLSSDYKYVKNKWVRSNNTSEIGIITSKQVINSSDYEYIMYEVLPGIKDLDTIVKSFDKFSPSSYKSLIQKVIRFRPDRILLLNGEIVDSKSLLVMAMIYLSKHPGSFNPDLKKFIVGMESFAKRLAVIIVEDSALPTGNYNHYFSLFLGSLLIQRTKNWKPDLVTYKNWLKTGLEAFESTYKYDIDYEKALNKKPYIINKKSSILECSSAILQDLGSFSTDYGLARGLAEKFPNINKLHATEFPEVMNIEHCVDQHWATGIAHYMDVDVLFQLSELNNINPYHDLFTEIWNRSSKLNPRDKLNQTYYNDYFQDGEYITSIKKAQRLYLVALQTEKQVRLKTKKTYDFNYELSDGWLAAMVGVIEPKRIMNENVLVTLDSDDPMKLIVIRKPARNMKKGPINPKVEELAKNYLRSKLKDFGIPLNQTKHPSPIFRNSKVFLNYSNEDIFYEIKLSNGTKIPWDDIKKLNFSFPIHPDLDNYTFEEILSNEGEGLEENAFTKLNRLIESYSELSLKRVLMYLSTFNSTLEMFKINRDGGGTYQSVSLYDTPAYQFLLNLSSIFPGAIRPNGPSKFDIPSGPLLWKITSYINSKIIKEVPEEIKLEWEKVVFKDSSNRIPRPYQIEIVEDMKQNFHSGNKGNFIWATVGLGKTLAVFLFTQYLKENGFLPSYIIYSLPSSAIKSIFKEIKYFGVDINFIIPLKSIKDKSKKFKEDNINIAKDCKPKPYCINVIEHDHLRNCRDSLVQYAADSIFIMDEVHKALNDTKRTSVSIEIARLSKLFIVPTGTPVIDDDTRKLISWLKLIVPYEVNNKNFYVAANTMISKTLSTGINVNRQEIVSKFNDKELSEYNNLVPPIFGGQNIKPTSSELLKAIDICYNACNRQMIKEVAKFLAEDRGVFLVGKDSKHVKQLYNLLVENSILPSNDIFVINKDSSIYLTDDAVNKEEIHDYKVVIAPIKKAEGYTLTRLSCLIMSVYPSNQATRTQINGRINRVGQMREEIDILIVHVGLLSAILSNHDKARSLEQALEGISKQVKI